MVELENELVAETTRNSFLEAIGKQVRWRRLLRLTRELGKRICF